MLTHMRKPVRSTAVAVTARIAVVTLMVSATIVGLTSAAHAAAEYSAWVDGGVLHYEYATGAPTSHVVVRTSGNTFTLDDSFGIFAGPGCSYPSLPDGSFVSCTGVGLPHTGYVIIRTGPTDDSIDFYPTGAYATIGSSIDAGAGNDTVIGSDGSDKMFGGPGEDYLSGWGAIDFLVGGAGADRQYGGAGFDLVYYNDHDHTTGVVASADGVAADDGSPGEGDTIGTDVEGIEGTIYDDVLTGNASDNTLVGCGGSDRLYGLDGNDELTGDGAGDGCTGVNGADVLVGGPGIDTVRYDERTVRVVVDLAGTTANDGESGEHDTVGADVENLIGGAGNDVLTGNAGANVIDGGLGSDKLFGLDGDDTLRGNVGDDFLYGGNDADTLDGSIGTDLCDLGAGGLTAIACEP
jgi:Ca2+-binding RTX toxin-like protein